MLVTDIKITRYQYCSESARHMASVGVSLKNQFVTLFCQLDLPENESPAARASAFVGEALRQLRRMPEYRSGRDTLQLADHLDVRLSQQFA